MSELETALSRHNWSLDGWRTRPLMDRLMKNNSDPVKSKSLWEQHCPWSDTNGGYVTWSKKYIRNSTTMVWSYQ